VVDFVVLLSSSAARGIDEAYAASRLVCGTFARFRRCGYLFYLVRRVLGTRLLEPLLTSSSRRDVLHTDFSTCAYAAKYAAYRLVV
jgi:hypothetical protein